MVRGQRKSGVVNKPTTKDDELPTHEDDPFLTCAEVGRRIGKDRATVLRWCNEGLMEAIRRPPYQYWAIRKSVVNRFLSATHGLSDRLID